MLSRRGRFPVSGTREEKHKAKTQQRQQKKMGSCVLVCLKMARDEMAPAVQAIDTIPRPVDLKMRLTTDSEDFLGSESGSSGEEEQL